METERITESSDIQHAGVWINAGLSARILTPTKHVEYLQDGCGQKSWQNYTHSYAVNAEITGSNRYTIIGYSRYTTEAQAIQEMENLLTNLNFQRKIVNSSFDL